VYCTVCTVYVCVFSSDALITCKPNMHSRYVSARYPAEEDELYLRFLNRRIVKGYPCNLYWLVSQMREILRETKPPGWVEGHCKHTWAVAWCSRYSVTTQCGYNSKSHDIRDRQTMIMNFHRFMAALQKSEPQVCALDTHTPQDNTRQHKTTQNNTKQHKF
jgi:hypothetical protein